MRADRDDAEGSHRLPSEIVVLTATYLDPASLTRLEATCKTWQQLLRRGDLQCWAPHARRTLCIRDAAAAGAAAATTVEQCVARAKDRCLDNGYWHDVESWKELCRRATLLEKSWSSADPSAVNTDVLGGFAEVREEQVRDASSIPQIVSADGTLRANIPLASATSPVWRARLDTAADANFVVTTYVNDGIEVLDAEPGPSFGRVLFRESDVPGYAHLEYQGGVACWSNADDIVVWKRWKLVHGDSAKPEPLEHRGVFVRIGTLPRLPGMRGFMLNDKLHLAIVSSQGVSAIHDLSGSEPRLIKQYQILQGATGHIEHNHDIVVYCMGYSGYTVYHKETGEHLGSINFRSQSANACLADALSEENAPLNTFTIDAGNDLRKKAEHMDAGVLYSRAPADFVWTTLQTGHLEERVFVSAEDRSRVRSNLNSLDKDEWGAGMLLTLEDGSTLMVARSRAGRLFVCSDLMGLISSLQSLSQTELNAKAARCIAILEGGDKGDREAFYEGGWLTLQNGRAAWQIDDRVYIAPLPSTADTLPSDGARVLSIGAQYNGVVPALSNATPISFMSLHNDALLTTYSHPIYALHEPNPVYGTCSPRFAKSVRIVHIAPTDKENVQDQNLGRRLPLPVRDDGKDAEALKRKSSSNLRVWTRSVTSQARRDNVQINRRAALYRLLTARLEAQALGRARALDREGRDADDHEAAEPAHGMMNIPDLDELVAHLGQAPEGFNVFEGLGDGGIADGLFALDNLDPDEIDDEDDGAEEEDDDDLEFGDEEDEDTNFDQVDGDFDDEALQADLFPQFFLGRRPE